MNRLLEKMAALRRERRKALSLFITAGYPTMDLTVPLVLELAKSGADLIELGIPFSDPIADGPTIQLSSEIALRNGASLRTTLGTAEGIRKQSDVPLILMGYANPIYRLGLDRFIGECSRIGIDGIIIADLPPEEGKEYRSLARGEGIATIFLAAPTTSDDRLLELDKCSEGFLYCISITGVTGERKELSVQTERFLQRARRSVTKNPILAGFGISTPNDARAVSRYCDGIIIGSALITAIQKSAGDNVIECAADFVRSMRNVLN